MSGPPTAQPPSAGGSPQSAAGAPTAGGSIYDIGYRHYDGPRLGRRHAVAALFRHAVRSVLGVGRGGRAKILPTVCIAVPALLALIVVGIQALLAQTPVQEPPNIPTHSTLPGIIAAFPTILVAAQAPELLGRDVRYRVLTLYFARALLRIDYVLAKLAALSAAVLAVYLVPQFILATGAVLLKSDVLTALENEAGQVVPVVGSAIVTAVVTAALALAVASFASRRAYATAAIFAAFTVPTILAAIIVQLDLGTAGHYLILADVGVLLDGITSWFFGTLPTSPTLVSADLPSYVPFIGALVLGLVSTAVLIRRYQGISA